jgi:hypothetical protein
MQDEDGADAYLGEEAENKQVDRNQCKEAFNWRRAYNGGANSVFSEWRFQRGDAALHILPQPPNKCFTHSCSSFTENSSFHSMTHSSNFEIGTMKCIGGIYTFADQYYRTMI